MTTTQPTPQLEELYRSNPLEACRKALQLTRDVRWQDRLEAIDKLLGTYGTEAIRGEWQNGYWCDIVAAYCNAGDTYALTVIHVRGDSWNPAGRFIVSSWGDWFEKNEKRFGLS
jgi:hypothetical protein